MEPRARLRQPLGVIQPADRVAAEQISHRRAHARTVQVAQKRAQRGRQLRALAG